MHAYRTHNCAELRSAQVGERVKLSGWVHRKRDHGNLLFVDLRDHYGITQIVTDINDEAFRVLDGVRSESVVTVEGEVVARSAEAVNPNLVTGEVEVHADSVTVQSAAQELPLPVAGEADYPEDIRLRYRYLDLRRERIHANIMLRSQVIASIRRRMIEQGFTEFQTPILTASSPEGARDYLVPSRVHPGKFYALPQAPQMFKQLIMVAGFDRYFQIAPCFRDEDARADRSPGEFYQLDFEMSFVTQEDVFQAIEPVLAGVFEEFANGKRVTPAGQFPRIPYRESMLKYGSDKPDLRNPIEISDVSSHFHGSGFGLFARIVEGGGVVRAIPAPATADKSRKFFDDMNDWARSEGHAGLGYITQKGGELGGPIAKNHGEEATRRLVAELGLGPDDGIFFAAGKEGQAAKLAAFLGDVAEAGMAFRARPFIHLVEELAALLGGVRRRDGAHHAPRTDDVGEEAEARAFEMARHVGDEDRIAQVRLVRAVSQHRLSIGDAREGAGGSDASAVREFLEHACEHRLDRLEDIFLRHEAHLEIELVEFAR